MSEEKKKQEVTINLDTLGVPIAIIFAAIIISVVIFITNRNDPNIDESTDKTANEDTIDNTNDDTSADNSSDKVTVPVDNDPYLGNLDSAKVAIVEFSDPECYYCQKFASETFGSIKTNYIDTGKIAYVYKEFPLGNDGDLRFTLAETGMCVFGVGGADAFSTYHKGAFGVEDEAGRTSLVSSLGINTSEVDNCMSNGTYTSDMTQDQAEGSNAGISGTPGFVVGTLDENGNVTGTLIAGAYPYSTFETELKKLLGE